MDIYIQPNECNYIFSNVNTNVQRPVYKFTVNILHTLSESYEQLKFLKLFFRYCSLSSTSVLKANDEMNFVQ